MVQLSQPYMTTGKTIALTIRAFVGRVMSLLFNTLSRFVIPFLSRNKRLLISWLQSPSIVTLEPKNRKSFTASIFSPSICYAIMGLDAMILVFLIFSLKLVLSLSPSPSSRGSLVPLHFLPLDLFSSVHSLSRVQFLATPWTIAHQASLSITNSKVYSNSCPLSQWCHRPISSSVAPSPPALNLSQHQGLFKWVSSPHQVAKVLEFLL